MVKLPIEVFQKVCLMANLNIALVCTNKNKYSETFIHAHLHHLKGKMHFLFQEHLPQCYSHDLGKTSEYFISPVLSFFYTKFFSIERQNAILNARIKSYLIEHQIQFLFCEYGPAGVAFMNMAAELKIPMLVHFFGYDVYRHDVLSTFANEYRQLFSKASACVVVSNHMAQKLRELKCPQEKIHIIPCGLDFSKFKPKVSKQHIYDFVFCARFIEKKGPIQILQAFYQVCQTRPKAKLCMIGDGPLMQTCMDFVISHQLSEQVDFKGILTVHAVINIYQKSDIFLSHARQAPDGDGEGIPQSMLEAAACGLAVISTFHNGIPEVIQNEQNGLLVNENDTNALSKAMLRLLDHDGFRLQLSTQLLAKLNEEYALEDVMIRMNELINNLVNDPKYC